MRHTELTFFFGDFSHLENRDEIERRENFQNSIKEEPNDGAPSKALAYRHAEAAYHYNSLTTR